MEYLLQDTWLASDIFFVARQPATTLDAYGFRTIINHMDDSNTNLEQSNMGPTNPKSTKSKTWVWLLVVIVMLAAGAVGGYYWGQMNKNQDVDAAKLEATKQASTKAAADVQAAKTLATQKAATDTTCNADELALTTMVDPAGGAAGTIGYDLVLTNTGKRTCMLGGFPGVSLVNDNGNQIGSPADRATSYTEAKLTLAPGGKAKAVVSAANSTNFTNGQCKSGATKFRVYPPNDTGYLSAITTLDSWCPGFTTSPMQAM